MSWRQAAELNGDSCLTLSQILSGFGAPISEEQAWAIVYECAKCLDTCLSNAATAVSPSLSAITDARHLFLHKEGFVHCSTFGIAGAAGSSWPGSGRSTGNRGKGGKVPRVPLASENRAISELSMVVYAALDYGLDSDTERRLSDELIGLFELMTSAAERDTDDEGIEPDHVEDHAVAATPRQSSRLARVSGISKSVMKQCSRHLSDCIKGDEPAQAHFRAVCRALVSEATELSTFLEKVSQFDEERGEELRELDMQDWARIWMQCIGDMRTGVKLKKVNLSKTPIEFELTPYEILMDDIRTRNYKLRKVEAPKEGKIKEELVRGDARDIILDFIRSRPPLRPVAERKLQPPTRRESTPVEALMDSIRNSSIRSSLRKTSGPVIKKSSLLSPFESSRTLLSTSPRVESIGEERPLPNSNLEVENDQSGAKRLLRPDAQDLDKMLNFETDDETDADSIFSRQTSRDDCLDFDDEDEGDVGRNEGGGNKGVARVAADLAKYASTPTTSRRRRRRRHSVSVCETPPSGGRGGSRKREPSVSATAASAAQARAPDVSSFEPVSLPPISGVGREGQRVIYIKSDSTSTSASSSRSTTPSSSQASSGRCTPTNGAAAASSRPLSRPDADKIHASLQSEFLSSEHWATALKTLTLSLDEVVHIRSVLTKAELEGLPLDGDLKDDVAKGKICFLCMKTRFGFFSWGVRCQLCKQQICSKCSTKMRIPLEHFTRIPVSALSGTSSSRQSSSTANQANQNSVTTVGSAPSSPEMRRRNKISVVSSTGSLEALNSSEIDGEYDNAAASNGFERPPHSLDVTSCYETGGNSGPVSLPIGFGRRSLRMASKKSRGEQLQGSLLQVCTDCREMVLQVIRSQTTAKRFQIQQDFFANLSPNYTKDEVF